MRWFPAAIVALMLGATIEAFYRGDWRYGCFWLFDAMITGWSSYMLRT
jgi:hypothetical protein